MIITVQPLGPNYLVHATESVWTVLMARLVDDGNKIDRDHIAHKLSDEALPTPTPDGGEDQGIVITELQLDQLLKVSGWVDQHGEALDIDYADSIDEPAKVPAKKRAPKPAGSKPENDCACGCGGKTASKWVPGHDSTYKSQLIKRVDNDADENAAEELVEKNWWKQDKADRRLETARENLGE